MYIASKVISVQLRQLPLIAWYWLTKDKLCGTGRQGRSRSLLLINPRRTAGTIQSKLQIKTGTKVQHHRHYHHHHHWDMFPASVRLVLLDEEPQLLTRFSALANDFLTHSSALTLITVQCKSNAKEKNSIYKGKVPPAPPLSLAISSSTLSLFLFIPTALPSPFTCYLSQ